MITAQDVRNADKEKFNKNGIVGILTRRFISCHITKYLARTSITPNQVTALAFITLLAAVYFLANQINLIVAASLIFLSKILDNVDGQIARVKNITTQKGAFYDNLADRFREAAIIIATSYALAQQTSTLLPFVYGAFALLSVYMLSVVLHGAAKTDSNMLKSAQSEFFLAKILRKLRISPQFLGIQSDTYLFITAVLIAFNQLFLVLLLFAVIINLYWIAILAIILIKR